MKKIVLISVMIAVPFCLSGCQSLWHLFLSCVVDIAPDRFTFEKGDTQLSIPVVASHSLENSSEALKRLVVIVHGAGLNAGKAFDTGNRIVDALGESKDQTMVIAPQFLEGIEPEERGLLIWDRQWRSGGVSLSEESNEGLPAISSYEVMDRLIRAVTTRNSNMDQVILLGHSAGGQFVSRYAALNTCHEDLQKRGASICYVAANPSSYLYLDATRYQLNPNGEILKRSREELTHCERYNDYKYGLENLYGYANSMSKQDIRARLTNRPVVFLLGQADTERTWSLDQSCEVEVQGQNRYERGLLYRHHLTLFTNAVQNPQHHWVIIPEVGHDADEMLTHRAFIQALKALPGPNNNFRANRP